MQFPSTPQITINNKTIRRNYKFKKPQVKQQFAKINGEIRAFRVLVIDGDNNNIGEMDTRLAIEKAREQGLDLIEVSPKANPPVCRIADYGKFQYQKSKQEKQAKSKQKKVETKGIRIGIRTDQHDLAFKKDQANKFLAKGNKVKIEINLRGREKAHQDLARENLIEFIRSIETPHKIEEQIKRYPGGFNTIIAPQ